ncbi:MAG TPA: hypothetical protein VFV03_04220 [Solirubrobacteraceae bacterium]|nr:hypothetical protein [Solirubrobacteraceae bacterium]
MAALEMGHTKPASCPRIRREREMAMTPKVRIVLAASPACVCVIVATVAWARGTLIVHERFTPDKLGASTNLSVTGRFLSTTGGPSAPITKFTIYGPAGMTVDARDAGTCVAAKLRELGPNGCPANSRAGFGGGVGLLELPKETIREAYTLDFFFASKERGRLALLVYASAVSPVTVELVLVAREVRAPKPYGLGFSVEVPLISALPGAPYASVESVFATLGAANVAYYKTVRGKKTLTHLKGIVVPKTCPRGGFPSEGTIDFADGTNLTVNPTIPCPRK